MSFISRSNLAVTGAYGTAALDNDQLRKLAPSIFAAEAHESRSGRFTYIPTLEIVDGMRAQGFLPVAAKQGKSRVPGKADFTKHMIRFRRADESQIARRIGGIYPEVAVINAHDGTSAYKVMAGLMRMVCLNGLLVSAGELSSVTVPHKGDVLGQVIDGSFEVLGESRRAIDAADDWAGVTLNQDETRVFAESAHLLRFGDADGNTDTAIQPAALLMARRRDDHGADLWRTMNRVQENVIRGGLSAMGRDANGNRRRTTTREVHGIDADVKLNRALWRLADEMAKLKQAA